MWIIIAAGSIVHTPLGECRTHSHGCNHSEVKSATGFPFTQGSCICDPSRLPPLFANSRTFPYKKRKKQNICHIDGAQHQTRNESVPYHTLSQTPISRAITVIVNQLGCASSSICHGTDVHNL